ncbi:protein of unknown function DUF214 [Spirosoma linguale DSM 74]|uniref:Uncharacterized protein n=2 Tax=Spirosoma TaxID=107 RepID=D2QIW6_SPILD|nr:protein of unknown function DUF214 [Spirosoma linguale DSM 74]
MLGNYLKIAFRSLSKNRGYSFINITGLAVGMTCTVLIFLAVRHETSYDLNHANGARVYRVSTENIDEHVVHSGTFTSLPDVLRNEVPEIERVVPIWREWDALLGAAGTNTQFKETAYFVDNGFFRLLDRTWIAGDPKTALTQPNTVVLTKAYAEKLFGTADAVGKTVRFANTQDLLVTGVLANHPTTTNFPLDVLVSFPTLKRIKPDYDRYAWDGFGDNFQVYALLKPGAMPQEVMGRSAAILTKYKDREAALHQRFALTALSDLHYGDNFSGRTANVTMLRTLSVIGLFVLLIACFNFINLATAQAFKRAKEVGIRKAVGSNRRSLMYQFLTEAGLITGLAVLLVILLTWLTLPTVSNTLGLPLSAADLLTLPTGLFMLLLACLTTLLAGTYPAYRLSNMAPIWALANNVLTPKRQWFTVRQGLVVVQFTVSLILISCALLINQQLTLFRNADLGFNKAGIVVVGLPNNRPDKLQALRNQLATSAQIKDISFSFNSASAESNWMQGMQYRRGVAVTPIKTQLKMGDSHYLDTYGIQLLAGEKLRDSDTTAGAFKVIANEVFVSRMGFSQPNEAIGQRVYYGDGKEFATIVGVTRNFNVNSLHQQIDPTLIQVVPNNFYQAGIKLQTESPTIEAMQIVLAQIETAWKTTYPDQLFDYSFLDDTLAKAYKAETRTAQLIETATLLAILIACLGLYGLATFTAEQRTKEIGVRKVLGATTMSVVALLSKDFLKLVLIAIVLALPVAWYAMSQWLQHFAFHITIQWWVFALTGLLMVLLTLLTVSFQSVKAALMNPVKSLRSE